MTAEATAYVFPTGLLLARIFVVYVAAVAVAVVAALLRWRPGAGRRATLLLPLWLAYVGVLSFSGVVRDPALRPPGIAYVVVPIVLFIALAVVRGRAAARLASALPLPLLIGAQVYRLGVEAVLHALWREGMVPAAMTLVGGNIEVVTAASAPLVALAVSRSTAPATAKLALAWNVFGLFTLANVIAHSALSAPGPLNLLRTVPPNLAIGTFPYTLLAGFFAPLGIVLHVLAMRELRARRAIFRPPGGAGSRAIAPQR